MGLLKNDIANLAIGHLAVSLPLIDITTDNSNAGKTIRRHLRMSLDTFLESHPWNFAKQEIALALFALNPSKMFGYEYVKPADCLVIRQIEPEGIFFDINMYEHQKTKWQEMNVGSTTRIWTNAKSAYAQYTTAMSEDAEFPTHFARGWSYQLALDIGPTLITNNWAKVRELLIPQARDELNRAIAYDMGRQPLDDDSPSPFILARNAY